MVTWYAWKSYFSKSSIVFIKMVLYVLWKKIAPNKAGMPLNLSDVAFAIAENDSCSISSVLLIQLLHYYQKPMVELCVTYCELLSPRPAMLPCSGHAWRHSNGLFIPVSDSALCHALFLFVPPTSSRGRFRSLSIWQKTLCGSIVFIRDIYRQALVDGSGEGNTNSGRLLLCSTAWRDILLLCVFQGRRDVGGLSVYISP